MSGTPDGTVFVIDDDRAVRESLVFLLEVEGLSARGFDSVRAFLDTLPAAPAGCVITDMQMPGRSGIDLIRALRERRAGLPVIVMTGQGEVSTALAVLAAGGFDFVEKPFQDNAIVQIARAALAAGSAAAAGDPRARATGDALASLAGHEREVLEGLVSGESNQAIAARTGVAISEVELIRARILVRMNASGLPDLIRLVAAARRISADAPEAV